MRSMVVGLLLSTHAFADDVNLLKSTATTVAVSSTVANANILPEHLVDGKLSTAWNSQTGELAGAWIAVRVPFDAHVKSIKLAVGFAHKRGKQDFFTMNPRIKKVRIAQGAKVLLEKTLDVDNRGLQDIPVDIKGGAFEIHVVEVVPGTKKAWRETCVSELEVWGSTPKVVKSKPSVRIRSLDAAPTLTREQCLKAALPDRTGRIVTNVEDLPITDAVVVCRVDHKEKGATETAVEIAAVKRTTRDVIGSISKAFTVEDRPNDGTGDTGSVQLSLVPLTATEKALLVVDEQGAYGPMMADDETVSTLFRVTASTFEPVFEFRSTRSGGEADHNDRCELQPFTPGKAMPTLVLECVEEIGHWHDENPGLDQKERVEKYRWDGTRFVKK